MASNGAPPNFGDGDAPPPQALLLILICCCPCICALLAAVVAYYVFGIIFLVQDQSVCSYESQIWIFAVIMLTVPCLAQIGSGAINDPVGKLVAVFVINIPLFVFGSLVLYDPSYPGYVCEAMKSEGLFIWSLITYWLLAVSVFFSCLGLFCLGILKITHPDLDPAEILADHAAKVAGASQKFPGQTGQQEGENDPLLPKDRDLESQKHEKPTKEKPYMPPEEPVHQHKYAADIPHYDHQPPSHHSRQEYHAPPAHHPAAPAHAAGDSAAPGVHHSSEHHAPPAHHSSHSPLEHLSEETISGYSVHDLKEAITVRGGSTAGLYEKHELQEELQRVVAAQQAAPAHPTGGAAPGVPGVHPPAEHAAHSHHPPAAPSSESREFDLD